MQLFTFDKNIIEYCFLNNTIHIGSDIIFMVTTSFIFIVFSIISVIRKNKNKDNKNKKEFKGFS